jgi:hypothetical protein
MFLRVVRAAGGNGVTHEYVRVVEAYREHGKTRHHTVLNLGRRDLLAAHSTWASAPLLISRMFSTCGRSIIRPITACKHTSTSPRSPCSSIAPSKSGSSVEFVGGGWLW